MNYTPSRYDMKCMSECLKVGFIIIMVCTEVSKKRSPVKLVLNRPGFPPKESEFGVMDQLQTTYYICKSYRKLYDYIKTKKHGQTC